MIDTYKKEMLTDEDMDSVTGGKLEFGTVKIRKNSGNKYYCEHCDMEFSTATAAATHEIQEGVGHGITPRDNAYTNELKRKKALRNVSLI